MNGEILALGFLAYLGLVAFALCFFRAGTRYDEWSEHQAAELEPSNVCQRTDDPLPIQN